MSDRITSKAMTDVERVLKALFDTPPRKITLKRGLQILDTAKSILELTACDNYFSLGDKLCSLDK